MTITETVSETRKPGRPRKYETELRCCGQAGMGIEIQTHRGKQNRALALSALVVVSHHPHVEAIAWLYDEAAMRAGGHSVRWHIYTELGRIYEANADDQEIYDLAETLCRDKPTGKVAVQWLRNYRLGDHKAGSAQDLALQIAKAIDEYAATHSGIGPEEIREALQRVSEYVTA